MTDLAPVPVYRRLHYWKYPTIATAAIIFLYFILLSDASIGFKNLTASHSPFQPDHTNDQNTSSTQPPPSTEPSKVENLPPLDHADEQPATEDWGTVFDPLDAVKQDEYVAVCMSVKGQQVDLVEFFVHHYHHMGIKRFYVMDDGSDPPLSSFEYPGIPRNALTFTWQDPKYRVGYMQTLFYNWCIERYSTAHQWMAFIDADEFLDTPGPENLQQILETFEKNETIGALGVNWNMHSSGGLLTRPESARKSFTTCIADYYEGKDGAAGEATDNRHIKTIIKLSKAGGPMNPHKFNTAEGSFTVGEDGDIVDQYAFRTPITRHRVGLHHYAVKSKAEYEEKMLRGNGMSDPKGGSFWDAIENHRPHYNCTEMVHYDP